MYGLVIGHWSFCYLSDNDLFSFLQRARTKLIHGRPKDRPGIIIVKEDITLDNEDNHVDDRNGQHKFVRKHEWYVDTF